MYEPQTVTKALISKLAKADGPDKPKEIRDAKNGLILRHQPSGYLGIYAELGRGKRERICDARRIIDDSDSLIISKVRAEAQRLRGQAASGRDFKSEREQKAGLPTLKDYLADTYGPWVKSNLRSGDANVNRIRNRFTEFLKLRLDQITPDKLEKWKAKRDVKPETINRDIATLRAALGRAVKLIKPLKSNPLEGVEMMKVDRKAQRVRALTKDEKQRLVATLVARDDEKRAARASGNEWRAERGMQPMPTIATFSDVLTPAVIVSLESGLRRGELFALKWPSIDLKAKTLTVEGETAKTFETREIPLNQTAYRTLRDWWLQQGQPKAGYVFTIDGGKIGSLKKSYHKVLADAGIERMNGKGQRVTWHSLRHTFGTLLGATNQVDPTTLKDLMGHANLSTTERYLHTDEVRKRAAVEALEA